MSTSEIATVLAWHDALSSGDLDTLSALSSDDIEIGDHHGAGQGHSELRQWAQRAAVTIDVGRIYYRNGVVVVEEHITGKGDAAETHTAASAFRVVDDQVTSIFRHRDLAAALSATEMSDEDLQD